MEYPVPHYGYVHPGYAPLPVVYQAAPPLPPPREHHSTRDGRSSRRGSEPKESKESNSNRTALRSQDGSAMLSVLMAKTKLCTFHAEGKCKYGDDCAFAHDESEIRKVPDLRKTRLCRAFSKGQCNDRDCNFAHGQSELRTTDFCYKTMLCTWYEKDKCINGEMCRFAHGLEELKAHGGDPDNQPQLEESLEGRQQEREQPYHQVDGHKRGATEDKRRGKRRRRGGRGGGGGGGGGGDTKADDSDVSGTEDAPGGGPAAEATVSTSPLCDKCFTTVAVHLGMTACAVCRHPRA